MSLSRSQESIATILFAAGGGDVLFAGGGALIAHGLIDRKTLDIDAFTTAVGEDFEYLVSATKVALEASGYSVMSDSAAPDGPTVRSWLVQQTGRSRFGRPPETVKVQICRDTIVLPPATSRVGPTIDPVELGANKVLAIYDRTRHRDFEDLYNIARRIPLPKILDVADQKQVTALDREILAECFQTVQRLSTAGFHDPDRVEDVTAFFLRVAHALMSDGPEGSTTRS